MPRQPDPARRRAAEALVESLVAHGVDRVFSVPGESFLAALDALHDEPAIQLVTTRHEGGAGLMAVADGKLTHRPGVAFVSRGPGAANAALAVHVAQQDAVPLVLFVGQVESENLGRGAFQEVDYGKTFADMAKWVIEVRDPERMSEFVARALHEAVSGTPGPVVVAVPEDVLEAPCAAPLVRPSPVVRQEPSGDDVAAVVQLLNAAARPLLLVGGDCEPEAARTALLAASERWGLPVAATNKHQTVFPNAHDHWVGHIGYAVPPALAVRLRESDLVLAVGTRLGDVSSQRYRFPRAPVPEQLLVHVHPDPAVIGRNIRPARAVVAHAAPFLAALAAAGGRPDTFAPWRGRLAEAVRPLRRWEPRDCADGIDFGHVVAALAGRLAEDAIVTLDAGNFVSWVHAFVPFTIRQDMLGTVGGAMGLGVPAAVAAALRHPDRQVVGFVGDGGFLMTGMELATAVQYRARLCLFVADNGSYGVIRAHQEKAYPRRVVGTALTNPDFAALAVAFGARGLRIDRPEQAEAVVAEALALASEGPVVVGVRTSLERISAFQTLSGLASAG